MVEKILQANKFLKSAGLALFSRVLFWAFAFGLLSSGAHAQEIEARAYSNAPIGVNFATGGIAQVKSSSYKLTTEALSLTHVLDVAGQSGRISLVLPYAELSGTGTANGQVVNASAEGLSDPLIKASVNLYGAPALSVSEFKNYQQDLIDRKSTRLNSSHTDISRMPSSA